MGGPRGEDELTEAETGSAKEGLWTTSEKTRGPTPSWWGAGSPPDVARPTHPPEPTGMCTALTARSPRNGSSSGASRSSADRDDTLKWLGERGPADAGATWLAHFT